MPSWTILVSAAISVGTLVAVATLHAVATLVADAYPAYLLGIGILLLVLVHLAIAIKVHESQNVEFGDTRAAIETSAAGLAAKLDKMVSSAGITIKYFDREKDGYAAVFEEATRAVLSAQKRILAVNSYMAEDLEGFCSHEKAQFATDAAGMEARRKDFCAKRNAYFRAIGDFVSANKHIDFYRIVQRSSRPHTPPLAHIARDDSYFAHISQMLEVAETNRRRVGVFSCEPQRELTFLLIDSTVLVLQINEFADPDRVRMHGLFIIEDHTGTLAAEFENTYTTLSNQATPVSLADLSAARSVGLADLKVEFPASTAGTLPVPRAASLAKPSEGT